MTTLSVSPSFPVFTDRDGSPLENGYIWIGTAALAPITNPISVYWDAARTQLAAQPIRTLNGYPSNNGTPARLYVGSDYSMLVQDAKGTLVYTSPNATERWSPVVVKVTAADIDYLPGGTGAQIRTVENRLRDVVSVKDFGVIGNGLANDTLALQTAINSGRDLSFPPGTYLAAGLTQSTNTQRFIALGEVRIVKNANGPIITSSGTDVEFNGIGFRGDAVSPTFTGDNVVSSGNNLRLINCGSRWAYGRAVKATGNHVQIIGTCDIYQTTDATASGFDIEIGVSGTATLYHQLVGIYSTQATGGIRLIDTGSCTILGGQFGKLSILSGTSPAGINGGMTFGARILGAVTVELSSAVIVGNQISNVAVSFAAGTSGCYFIGNTLANGATVANSGNVNNYIQREVSTGSGIQLKLGPDSSAVVLTFDPATGQFDLPHDAVLPNNRAYRIKNAAGTGTARVIMTSVNNLAIANDDGAIQLSSTGTYQLVSLPTSSAGLPSGALWRDAGASNVIKMVP